MKPTWAQRVADATARGRFTDEDVEAAQGWPSCAVGERVPGLPNRLRFVPQHLLNLGLEFETAVFHDQVNEAEKLLGEIAAAPTRVRP